ncbi:AAA family ATPase [Georgenia sp. Z1491]|uniref:AAA family ATPase n=1 Tax=Georgenia sp. Z1491 TaxID=3416707 RepID=UPI003CF95317
MPRVVLMCGPAGSGKSTVARGLERDGMVRLSIDAEAWARGERSMPLDPRVLGEIESALQVRLLDLVRAGRDVVVDLSFWSRAMRETYRALLSGTGVVPETIYLATPRDVCLARLRARSAAHPDDFALDPELAGQYHDHLEVPTPDEGPLTVLR